jgi:hypothetical protein
MPIKLRRTPAPETRKGVAGLFGLMVGAAPGVLTISHPQKFLCSTRVGSAGGRPRGGSNFYLLSVHVAIGGRIGERLVPPEAVSSGRSAASGA